MSMGAPMPMGAMPMGAMPMASRGPPPPAAPMAYVPAPAPPPAASMPYPSAPMAYPSAPSMAPMSSSSSFSSAPTSMARQSSLSSNAPSARYEAEEKKSRKKAAPAKMMKQKESSKDRSRAMESANFYSAPSMALSKDEDEAMDDGDMDMHSAPAPSAMSSLMSGLTPSMPMPQSPAPAPAPVVSGPPPTALFMQQKFDGSFEISDALAALVFTTSSSLRSGAASQARLSALDSQTKEKVFATLFVLAKLTKLWGAYENSWEMTADKAKNWVVTLLMKQLNVDRTNARKMVDELIAAI